MWRGPHLNLGNGPLPNRIGPAFVLQSGHGRCPNYEKLRILTTKLNHSFQDGLRKFLLLWLLVLQIHSKL